uniref:Uncharacterized protein n=1 Tax=Panagrolaimus sp. JU765 TaxID=591449 RepID=A0AC34RBC2_9BILA
MIREEDFPDFPPILSRRELGLLPKPVDPYAGFYYSDEFEDSDYERWECFFKPAALIRRRKFTKSLKRNGGT